MSIGGGLAGLHWSTRGVKLTGVSTASRSHRTIVKIELAITDPFELGDILRQLAEIRGPAPTTETADA